MKKGNIWLPISIILGVVIIATIAAYGYMLFMGHEYYEGRSSEIETAALSSNSIDIKADDSDDSEDYAIIKFDDFSTSVKPVVSVQGREEMEEHDDGDSDDEDEELSDEGLDRADDENGEYILPESNKRKLTESDLEDLTAKELTYARNEIYARHGRKFQSRELQEYFDSKDWYEIDEDFDDHDLKGVERENAEFIAEYQKDEGKTYKVN